MTHAQKYQWYVENWVMHHAWDLPQDTTLDRAISVAHKLISNFDALRTVFRPNDGALRQYIHPAKRLQVRRITLSGDEPVPMKALIQEFAASSCARAHATLYEFIIVEREGNPEQLILIIDHVLVDAAGRQLIARCGDHLLNTPGDDWPTRESMQLLHPTDLAEAQQSDSGQRQRHAAAQYLDKILAVSPNRAYFPRITVSSGRRYWIGDLRFPDGPDLLRTVQDRYRVPPTTAVLAAYAIAACYQSGNRSCTIRLSSANRHNDFLRNIAGATAQRTLILIDVPPDTDVIELMQNLNNQQLIALRHASYDPADLLESRARHEYNRGIQLISDVGFNFISIDPSWRDQNTNAPVRADSLTVDWTEPLAPDELFDRGSRGIGLTATLTGDELRLALSVDTCLMTREEASKLIKAITEILRGAACGDRIVRGRLQSAGVEPFIRSSSWVNVDGSWLDLAASAELLCGQEGIRSAAISLESTSAENSGSPTIVATLTTSGPLETRSGLSALESLRQDAFDRLDRTTSAIVPTVFVIRNESDGTETTLTARDPDQGNHMRTPGDLDVRAQAVRVALLRSHELAEISLNLPYVMAGGSVDRFHSFVEELLRLGYEGFTLTDTLSLRSLAAVAAQLSHIEPTITADDTA
jgi:hypothetical protein